MLMETRDCGEYERLEYYGLSIENYFNLRTIVVRTSLSLRHGIELYRILSQKRHEMRL